MRRSWQIYKRDVFLHGPTSTATDRDSAQLGPLAPSAIHSRKLNYMKIKDTNRFLFVGLSPEIFNDLAEPAHLTLLKQMHQLAFSFPVGGYRFH